MKTKTKKPSIRPLGAITTDLEPLLLEMVEQHDMQTGEILALIHGYLQIHCPGAKETYTQGGHPVFYYGPEDGIK